MVWLYVYNYIGKNKVYKHAHTDIPVYMDISGSKSNVSDCALSWSVCLYIILDSASILSFLTLLSSGTPTLTLALHSTHCHDFTRLARWLRSQRQSSREPVSPFTTYRQRLMRRIRASDYHSCLACALDGDEMR